uniref:Alkaline ceramidase n=1 Tax=Aceria tosichella TaxID=561515 RepID=A0A6G1SF27_9ACAR
MAPYNQAYQDSTRGLWAQTASIDWCESNYELSYYVAEFWNTISNLAFILPQLSQFVTLSKHKNVEPAFNKAFLSLALVGIGSFCFHMTLARPMQMFDETSMILVSLHSFYLLYIIKKPDVNKQKLLFFLTCYGLLFLSLYAFLVDWPIFHHSTFGLLVYASMYIGYQLKKIHGSHYKFWTVFIMQHLAFAFWAFDKHYCEILTQFRNNHVPLVFRPLFQFHAVWHLLMGLSSHIFICGVIRLRVWIEHREQLVIRYRWLGLWIVLENTKAPGDNCDTVTSPKTKQTPLERRQQRNYHHSNDDETANLRYRREQDKSIEQTDRMAEETDINQNVVHSHEIPTP